MLIVYQKPIKPSYDIITKEIAIKLLEEKQVRSLWDVEHEKWYFSTMDVIQILTETDRPIKYWSNLKVKLKKEASEVSEKIGQLKTMAEDGKMRITDLADTEQFSV